MKISHPYLTDVYPSPAAVYALVDGKLSEVPAREAVIKASLIPILAPLLAKRAAMYTGDYSEAYREYKTRILKGSTSEVPKPYLDEVNFKIRSNNGKAWRAAKSDPTIIVVSPYDVGKITVRVDPVALDAFDSNDTYRSVQYDILGFKLITEGPAKNTYKIGSYYYPHSAHVRVHWRWVTRTFRAPIPLRASTFRDFVDSKMCIDNAVVTSTVAAADRACMDVLTTLAELPETAKSILNGFKLVASAIVALKKRELHISNAHKRRLENIARHHTLSIAQLNLHLRNATSPGQRKHWERKIAQENKKLSKTRENAVKEFIDALASIWMNFRYNIMPNVYAIEDLIKLIESYHATYHTARDNLKDSIKLELDGWTPFACDLRHTSVIKRLIDPNVRFSSLTQANFFVTAWELVPLSFVIDWFVNIGDIISAVSSPNLALREGATYSWKVESSSTIVHDDGFVAHIDIKQFKRRVMTPSNHIELSFNFDLSLYQKIDSLALLWSPIKRLIQNSKR